MQSEGPPSSPEMIRWLCAFQEWATARVMDAAACVDKRVLGEPGAIPGGQGDGSIYATLAHIALAEDHWLARWLGHPHVQLRTAEDVPDLRDLIEGWWEANERRRQWLATLDDQALGANLRWFRGNGEENVFPLWQTLLHVANHSTHHRAEVCTALTAAGTAPQSVDMIDWIRARCPGS